MTGPEPLAGQLLSSSSFRRQVHAENSAVIKQVAGMPIQPKHRAMCYCGPVESELDLPDGIVDSKHCDCCLCQRKGAVIASVPLTGIRIVKGAQYLVLYPFNTLTANHDFCSACGIYTHHQRRQIPTNTATASAASRGSILSPLRTFRPMTASVIQRIGVRYSATAQVTKTKHDLAAIKQRAKAVHWSSHE